MNIRTMKRLLLISILGLAMFAFAEMHPARVSAAPLRQTGCTLPATVTTAVQLANCITAANTNGAGLDTITLGADITLSAALPQITTAITVEGAGYFIDGGNSRQIFNVGIVGDLTINEAILQNGFAINGGAIYNDGTLTLINSTLSGNSADYGGAVLNTLTSTVTATNNTFSGNTATSFGGAIYNSSDLILTHNTFADNSATNAGSISSFGTLHLAGNIFAAGASGTNCVIGTTVNDNGYNLSDDATCINGGFGSQTNATLNLGALTDNGGITPTHLPGAGSAAIGAIYFGYVGNNNGVLLACNQTTTDQIGQNRPLTINIACTSGAVEATTTSLTIIKDASPAIGTDFDFTINSAPLTSYSGTTSGKPFWTRPNEGGTCTLSTVSTRYHVQAFVVDTSGNYDLQSTQQGFNGYIHLYQDSFNPLDQCTGYVDGDDDSVSTGTSQIGAGLQAGRVYYLVTSGFAAAGAGNFTNSFSGVGTVYTRDDSLTLDDAVPDDSDGVNASTTFAVNPGTYAVAEAGLSGWDLTGATCTGASGSVTLIGDTLSVQVSNGEAVQCTFTNETLCPASWAVTNENELAGCIIKANNNESPSPTADTIMLGADITLTTALPQITSEIMLDGANQFIDGGDSVQLFTVVSGGAFTVNQATLQNGYASYGGSINNNGGTLTVSNSTISGNYAAVFGGGIYNNGGTLTVTNSTFSSNESLYSGGGVYNNAGTVNVLNSTILGNSVTSGDSGGIRNDGTLNVTDSTISGNSTTDNGGGILNTGTATVTNSTISGNTATYDGGGIYNSWGTLTVTNSTFSGNSAAILGGGIFNGSTLTVSNSTFSGNSAPGSGGGVYNSDTAYLAETIFAKGGMGDNCFGTLTDNGYNLSDDASCGFSGTSADNANLSLSALSVTTTPGQQVHTPQLGSDAIGVIPNGTAVNNNGVTLACNQTTTDQLGASRPINSGDACTSGAVEVTPICTSWTVTTAVELSDCITLANANESPSPTADTITLGADIMLSAALPQITSEITLEGANHFIDGEDNVQLFYVDGGGDFTVNQAALQNGFAESGGGINNTGTLTVTNSTFSGNLAFVDSGGGINNSGTLMVTNSTFSGNEANNYGGGINNTGTVTVTNSTFSGNRAIFGGGINNTGTLTVTTTTFSGNRADWPVGDGGGIYNRGTVTVANSTFADNRAYNNGGGINNTTNTLTVTNSTFSGNSASNRGGGIFNADLLTLTNSTFADNTVISGGTGVHNNFGTVHLAGNVFAAGLNGNNCVLSGGGTITDNGYNLSDDATCANGGTGSLNNATLNLSALSITTTPGQQVHTPTAPSDAIGAIPYGTTINNNGVTLACNQTTTDQLGADRPITLATACTAGAVEVAMPPICTSWTVTTAAELSDCITLANANESPSPTADTITLGANITLTTALPQITSAITLEGAGYAIDGGNSVRILTVNSGGDFTVNQATLQNGSTNNGGGIDNNGTLTVTNSIISGNSATYYGGGIYNDGTLIVTASTISGNSAGAGGGGGGIYNFGGTVTVTNSTFSGNFAAYYGGGIYNNGTLTVTNSTFSGNSATIGGGVYNHYSTLTVTNSTFSGNSATVGGGVYNNYGTARLAGTIFAAGLNGANCVNGGGTITDNGYNLSDDGTCANGSIGSLKNATLNLDVLADNGGATWTHALMLGSDAINVIPYGTTINNNGTTWSCNDADPFTDQRGVARPQGAGCDSGAYELDATQTGPNFVVNTAADTDDGFCDLLGQGTGNQDCTLREAINAANAAPDASEITFAGDYTITLTAQLPFITSEITINGAGRSVTVDGDNNTYQILTVDFIGVLTMNSLTLSNGLDTLINFGELTVLNSTLRDGDGEVGGIYSGGGQLIIANSTFYNNDGSNVGAVQAEGSTAINNSTFSGNSGSLAGGVYSYLTAVTINNSIITNSTGGDCATDGGSFSGSNNLIDEYAAGACAGISNAAVTNLAAGPADQGGDTPTIALLTGSNALDAGDNATCEATDQRGVARPQSVACDVGAYEFWGVGITAETASDALLSWSSVTTGCTYDIFESTTPYFTPTGAAAYTTGSLTQALAGRLGTVGTNYFYVNRATCGGATTAYSNEVGEFDFAIVPGTP